MFIVLNRYKIPTCPFWWCLHIINKWNYFHPSIFIISLFFFIIKNNACLAMKFVQRLKSFRIFLLKTISLIINIFWLILLILIYCWHWEEKDQGNVYLWITFKCITSENKVKSSYKIHKFLEFSNVVAFFSQLLLSFQEFSTVFLVAFINNNKISEYCMMYTCISMLNS